MANLALIVTLLFQVVASPEELKCIGFIHDSLLPLDLYIAGTEREGIQAYATQGQLIYLDGKLLSTLKPGDIFWVVRPEGRIKNSLSLEPLGIYYKELGTIKIESVNKTAGIASVVTSCNYMYKGDLVIPQANKATVKFTGRLSDRLTPFPEGGLAGSIVLGQDDLREMATGHFCFVDLGARDGVKLGDRFTIFRPQAPFEPRDLAIAGKRSYTSYQKIQDRSYEAMLVDTLMQRNLPPRALGDLIIVEVGESTATGKIVNSSEEIHLGDLVARAITRDSR